MSTLTHVDRPGAKLAVHLDGDSAAPAVVMTHSLMADSRFWDAQAALLVSRGLRVVRIDMRGHGASSVPSGTWTLDDLADDVIAVMDALGTPKAHYLGLSIGGMFGFGLGMQHADRLLSLVLCACRPGAQKNGIDPWAERIATAPAGGTRALAGPTAKRWFGEAFLKAHPDIETFVVDTIAATSLEGFVGCARAIQGLAYGDGIADIALPTTLIVGANDLPLPTRCARPMRASPARCST